MKVAIFNYNQEDSLRVREELVGAMKKTDMMIDNDHPDVIVSIGGDGTLLSAVHQYEDQLDHVRFVGIHTGHLGFYTDWRDFEVEDLVDSLSHDQGESVAYPMLKMNATLTDGSQINATVLNEVTVRNVAKTMVADIFINNRMFELFRGDGLCFSTPTGSTAYNKSISGAVMDPWIHGFQMTEMASLNNRVFRTLGSPMIFGPDTKVIVKTRNATAKALTADGMQLLEPQDDDKNSAHLATVSFSVADQSVHFARYRHTPFWHRVKNAFIGSSN